MRPGLAKITFGTGGMLDMCVGADRPAFEHAGRRRLLPDRRLAPGGRLTWGVEAVMLSAGTAVEWLRDDLGLIAAPPPDEIAAGARHRRRRVRTMRSPQSRSD